MTALFFAIFFFGSGNLSSRRSGLDVTRSKSCLSIAKV